MLQQCNGCGVLMTIEQALCCKVGSLVHIQHDAVVDEWHHLCGCALTFGPVKRKPQIYSCVSRQQRLDALSDTPSGEEDTLTAPTDQPSTTSACADAGTLVKREQIMICFHVDDCKISHESSKVIDDTIDWL
jgi:hypothetical protein